jgi:hypothetical protein
MSAGFRKKFLDIDGVSTDGVDMFAAFRDGRRRVFESDRFWLAVRHRATDLIAVRTLVFQREFRL